MKDVSAVNQIRAYCEAKGVRVEHWSYGIRLLDSTNDIVYSIIPDRFSEKRLETWDFHTHGNIGTWRTVDSVKRSIRRLLAEGKVSLA